MVLRTCLQSQTRTLFKNKTKQKTKNNYLRLDGQSKFEEKDARELQNVHFK